MVKDNKSAYNANVYDEHIVSVLPYYSEYHGQIMDLVDAVFKKEVKWLDTGCGTGTLASRVLEHRDDVRFTLCDPSEKMLDIAKEKLAGKDIRYYETSSQEMSFKEEFDVVTAVQSHHYLQPDTRRAAVKKCYEALNEGGLFIAFENIKMSTEESDKIALGRWTGFLAEHGNSPEDVKMQTARRGVEVLPISIEDHIRLIRECGFRSVDLLWASYLQAGFWAIK